MKKEISDLFKWFYNNNYITARDGNACTRLGKNKYLVTKSGVKKHSLKNTDFIVVNEKGESTNGSKPSIETLAHIYALKETNNKCSIHVHSPMTVALFERYNHKLKELEAELMYNWPELFRYTTVVPTVPDLLPGSGLLHNAIGDSFKKSPEGHIVVMLKHGVLAVADSMGECKDHIERLEHVCKIILNSL